MFSWKGAVFWRWFKWNYDVDDMTMAKILGKMHVPSKVPFIGK